MIPALIREMDDADEAALIAAHRAVPHLFIDHVAPDTVTPERIAALAAADIVVSIGHSGTPAIGLAAAAAKAGASMVTHLFNAMSQVGNRDPGLAGRGTGPRLFSTPG